MPVALPDAPIPERGRRRWGSHRPIVRAAAILLVGLCTANCSRQVTQAGIDPKYGVRASPKVIPDGEPIPKGGGRQMVGKPYVVGETTYVPREGRGYSRDGEASWYGSAFHGRLTANGEVFDRESIAAAHPTLPLPSYVRVTNLTNRRSMIVRVNDRGPYERGRLIDVSERAADALGFHRAGTTHVRVEYVGTASLAGSDDRKLLATLRSDGVPAGGGRPVMLADLGEPVVRPPELQPLAFESAMPPAVTRVASAASLKPALPAVAPPLSASAPIAATARLSSVAPAPVHVASLRTAPPSRPLRLTRDDEDDGEDAGDDDVRKPTPQALPPHRPTFAGLY